ncbi:MAG: thiamine-phosphate kinase [Chloroflexota bacterium]|nr:thiamine-phosphate kinase [Chloroflexota bacterium]
MSGLRVSDVGEFGLIDRLSKLLPRSQQDLLVGVGDDVAVLRSPEGRHLLLTSDAQVEGVHFLKERTSAEEIGRKLVAVNVSDIASKGGQPRHLLVSLVLPPEIEVGWVEGLYTGIRRDAELYGLDVAGGNVASSPDRLVVDAFLMGDVAPEFLVQRSGARPGDIVCMTGCLGDAAAGLLLLVNTGLEVARDHAEVVRAALVTPTARLREGQVIAAERGATAMMDISDGLLSDLGHLSRASSVGARLWADLLPISDAARAVARLSGRDPVEWALSGGEDYELLFSAPPDRAAAVAKSVRNATGTPVTVVGEVRPTEEGVVVVREGAEFSLSAEGWDHFRR